MGGAMIEGLITYYGFEEAFLGIGEQFSKLPIAVYDREKCIELLARDMEYEEAEEYFIKELRSAKF